MTYTKPYFGSSLVWRKLDWDWKKGNKFVR